ncbi:MAG: NAD(P)/FAD-dependent oxidoreductase [Cyclobacteriaceae bacterium]
MKDREMKDFDAVVVGTGPNGLAAGIVLVEQGLKVLAIEGKDQIGGGMRTQALTLPGFHHDVCSAIHPMAVAAPFLKTLPLEKYGLELLHPQVLAAHPFQDGSASALYHSLDKTAENLGRDQETYLRLMNPLINHWEDLSADFLAPLKIPKNPFQLAKFGLKALQPAHFFAKRFVEDKTKGLWAGMAAHGIQPLDNLATSAIALVLMAAGHVAGWPVFKGGSEALATALSKYFMEKGGEIQTGWMVKNLAELPPSKAILFDLGPKQLLEIAGERFSPFYKWQLNRYRYGMGVFKMDFALEGPIPWIAPEARAAGTVHLGGKMEAIRRAEALIWKGQYADDPYVLVAQQSLVDPSRAPEGKHTAWAYSHVPSSSTRDLSKVIIDQIEKSAPGFRKLILAQSTMNCKEIQDYNPNYIGGDINGGVQDITQIFTRPTVSLSPYRTSAKGIYICSSSTPPGGGVHGMCGFHAAKRVLKDLF